MEEGNEERTSVFSNELVRFVLIDFNWLDMNKNKNPEKRKNGGTQDSWENQTGIST